jgi:hypothetical protein
MSEISQIMWDTMQTHYRKMVDMICEDYETNPKYTLKKVYENGVVVGFGAWYEENGYRILEAGYFIGKNKTTFFRYWREFAKFPKLKAFIQKANIRMVDFYKKMGFVVEKEDRLNLLFRRGD